MKTKKLKRVLSAFLAVLMVLSVMPMSVFAATDDDLATLKNAITAYETKMDGTVYTNMRAAYDAYIYAKECADSYEYGRNTGLDLTGAANALNTAIGNLGTFNAAKTDVQPSKAFPGDSEPETNAAPYYENLLYAADGNSSANFDVTQAYCQVRVYIPTAVALYDGVTTPRVGVMFGWNPVRQNGTSQKTRSVSNIYSSNSEIGPDSNWLVRQTTGTMDFTWAVAAPTHTVGYTSDDKDQNTYTKSLSGIWGSYGTPSPDYGIGSFAFNPSFGQNQYSKSYTSIPMGFWSGDNSASDNGNGTASTSLYVINYKALTDALATTTSVLQNVKNYDNDWADMKSFMSALDAATTFNPSAYNYADTANAVASCAAGIESAVNAINSTKNALQASDDSYVQLREALAQSKSTYDLGNNNTYEQDSWNNFATAYEAARKEMNDVVINGYKANGSDVATFATTLNDKYSALEHLASLADTTEMLAAVAKANTINQYLDYLTAETKAAFVTAFDNAKSAFQNNDTTLPTIFTEDQQGELDVLTDALNEAIDAIVLDTTRLASGLSEARGIDQSTVFDATALNRAISEADAALNNANSTDLTADNIANIVSGYVDACEKIEEAIEYAETPYSQQQDSVTNTSSGSATVVWGDGHNTTTYTYPKGVVIVKATSASTEFNIGKYQLYSKNEIKGNPVAYSQLIYEFGITNSSTGSTTGSMSAGQFRLAGFDGDVIAKTDADETVQGAMYYTSGSAPASVSAGLSDGRTDTYVWMKEGEFTRTSDVMFIAPSLATGKAPTTTTYTANKSYLYAQCKYFNWIDRTETYNGLTDTPMDVTVVDISPLCYLLDSVNQYTDLNQQYDYKWYTTDSYNALLDAVGAAKLLTNNNSIHTYDNAQEYGTAVAQAWNTLKNAITGLTVANYLVTFNYKTATGTDTSAQRAGSYGTELVAPTDIPTYVVGNNRYVFEGWDKEVASTITGNDTYTAQYREEPNLADFSGLDAAVEQVTTVEDNMYSASDLEELNENIANLTYYNLSAEEREKTLADKQDYIDAEASAVRTWKLEASDIDLVVAEASLEKAKRSCDSDGYDINAIQSFELSKLVEVNGKSVSGLLFASQKELDAAINALVTSLQPMMYTVELNGSVLGTYEYGTRLVVTGDGQALVNEDIETNVGEQSYAWYYSFNSVQVTKTTSPKYMTTASSFGFVVKGNTYLTTAEADSSDETYAVTFVNGINNHIYDVLYTTGSVTMPAAPDCAFYTFTGYDNGESAGNQITVSENTVITANYQISDIDTYMVNIYGMNDEVSDSFQYNDKVTLTDPDVEIWIRDEGKVEDMFGDKHDGWSIVAFGDTISLRACEDVDVYGLTMSDFNDLIDVSNILINSDDNYASSRTRNGIVKADTKFSMIGQFAVPEGATAVEYGMLFTEESGKTLTLENASADSTIKRLKASKHTGESDDYGQYVISIKSATLGGSYDFTYRSYLTYTMNGKTYTVYADKAVTENVQF